MDLSDVANSFAQTKTRNDEETMRAKQVEEPELKTYEFGTIILN